jgi:hypothetical protein
MLPNAHFIVLNKLYLSERLIIDNLVPVKSLKSYPLLEEVASLLGVYFIYWDGI